MIAYWGVGCQQKKKSPCPGDVVLHIKIAMVILFLHRVVGSVNAFLLAGVGCLFWRGGKGCQGVTKCAFWYFGQYGRGGKGRLEKQNAHFGILDNMGG